LQSALESLNIHYDKSIYVGTAQNVDRVVRADAYMLKQMIRDIENSARFATTGCRLKPGHQKLLEVYKSLDKPKPVAKSPFLAQFKAKYGIGKTMAASIQKNKRPASIMLPVAANSEEPFKTPSPAKRTINTKPYPKP